MVIRRNDRISDVLRSDESLIDVLVALSPAFERLRNPAMRKVMSRLVTVEQAARMANVDADLLVARLNGHALGIPAETTEENPLEATAPDIPEERIVDLDVREDLRNGREPFSRIMAARRELPDGGALRVRAIFEPVPLYRVMEKQGLQYFTEELGPEDWRVWFFAAEAAPTSDAAAPARDSEDAGEGVIVLDVRGLEPPEPMVRTLAALEELPDGATLLQINVRVPQFLLPLLEERGFSYEVREQSPDLVRLFIRRAQ